MLCRNIKRCVALAVVALSASVASATPLVAITEFNSNSGDGGNFEFVEFTNVSNAPVDMTNWSEDDSTRSPHKTGHILSAFGTLQPHESAIFTEASPDAFRIYWWGSVAAAPAGLKIIGPYTNDNLSSSGDEVNLYDNNNTLVDRLTYNGGNGGSANGVTRNPGSDAVLGTNANASWVNSAIGDSFGSFHAANNAALIGNPGSYPVPEPSTIVLGLMGATGLVCLVRRRQNVA